MDSPRSKAGALLEVARGLAGRRSDYGLTGKSITLIAAFYQRLNQRCFSAACSAENDRETAVQRQDNGLALLCAEADASGAQLVRDTDE